MITNTFHRLIALFIIMFASTFLFGCDGLTININTSESHDNKTPAMVEESTEKEVGLKTLKDKIEDFDTYVAIDNPQDKQMPFPPGGCNVYKDYLTRVESGEIEADPNYQAMMEGVDWEKNVAFYEKLISGDIKKKEFYDDFDMSLSLYLTPRYGYLDTDEVDMNKCIEGVGYLTLFKVFDDHLLWGNTQCTGGVGFIEEQKPGITKAIEECEKVRRELLDY